MPISSDVAYGALMHVVSGWASAAVKALAGAASGGVLMGALGAPAGALPLALGSFDPSSMLSSFLALGAAHGAAGMPQHIGLLSITAALMFIGSIRGLNKHSTSK